MIVRMRLKVQRLRPDAELPGYAHGPMEDAGMDLRAVEAVIKAAATGKIGDGKIFLSKIDDAIRIRSQERGVAAV